MSNAVEAMSSIENDAKDKSKRSARILEPVP